MYIFILLFQIFFEIILTRHIKIFLKAKKNIIRYLGCLHYFGDKYSKMVLRIWFYPSYLDRLYFIIFHFYKPQIFDEYNINE
jgi:hypothetical protein